jgi:hypothetical protein
MCGIVGISAQRDVVEHLISGLKALEYRGYDSAGIAVLTATGLDRRRAKGKVRDLEALQNQSPLSGHSGIAHTRWATHGVPNTRNAHPHISGDSLSVVHNGIIENHEALRAELRGLGYEFNSDTDTEVIAHLVEHPPAWRRLAARRGARGARAHARRLCRGADFRTRAGRAGGRTPWLSPGGGAGRRRELPRLRHPRPAAAHAALHLSGRGRRGRDPLRLLARVRRTRRGGHAAGEGIAFLRRRSGTRRVPPLHAQGNPRAAAGDCRHAGRPHRRADACSPECSAWAGARCWRRPKPCTIACGTSFHAGRWRATGSRRSGRRSLHRRDRQRVPLPHRWCPRWHLVRHHLAVRRNRRYAGRAAAGQQRGYLARLAICNVPESSLVRESDWC